MRRGEVGTRPEWDQRVKAAAEEIGRETGVSEVGAAQGIRVADHGTVVLGGGFRLPAVRNARVADRGAVVLGGGFRLPARDVQTAA